MVNEGIPPIILHVGRPMDKINLDELANINTFLKVSCLNIHTTNTDVTYMFDIAIM